MSDNLIRQIQRRIAQSPSPDLEDVLALYALLQRTGATLGEVWVVQHLFEDDSDYNVTTVCATETGAYLLALETAKEIVDDRLQNWADPEDVDRLRKSFEAVTRHAQVGLKEGFDYWKKVTEPRLSESITVEKAEFRP